MPTPDNPTYEEDLAEEDLYQAPETIGMGLEQRPESALHGQYIEMVVTVLWVNQVTYVGGEAEKRGITFRSPFGKEIPVAIPIVESPTEGIPEGLISLENLQKSIEHVLGMKKEK